MISGSYRQVLSYTSIEDPTIILVDICQKANPGQIAFLVLISLKLGLFLV